MSFTNITSHQLIKNSKIQTTALAIFAIFFSSTAQAQQVSHGDHNNQIQGNNNIINQTIINQTIIATPEASNNSNQASRKVHGQNTSKPVNTDKVFTIREPTIPAGSLLDGQPSFSIKDPEIPNSLL
ncbi:MAG: hypothetical protein F6K36_21820 [Symploca sp. SIO3C6]|nr:hypothetical protein [Symploca sp. SIO3C6]